MSPQPPVTSGVLNPRVLLRELSEYATPIVGRSLLELAMTAVPFLMIVFLMWTVFASGYWLALLLAVPAGGLLVRLFMIQHDCGHGSFFHRRATNDWVGRAISVLTLTPYDYWRRTHALHHARNGNLDQRGIGDIDTLTVREFTALGWRGRLFYRLYRHPIVMFGLGPAWIFLVQHRVPVGFMRGCNWRPWLSAMATNVAIMASAAAIIWHIGLVAFLLIHLPIVLVAATLGIWLFYVQHQFEEAQWDSEGNWSFHEAALHGSSHYDLPAVLRWLTANIGVHHVHHLSSRIPCYRLPEVLRDRPELREVGRLTLWQSFKNVSLALWDENERRLVSFRQARAR